MEPSSARQVHQSQSSPGGAYVNRPSPEWEGMRQSKDQHQSPAAPVINKTSTVVLPTSSPMPTNQDPVKWSREEVHNWLKWCQEEFSLDNVNAEKFTMNGKALCLMPMQSFRERAPDCGDILYQLLQKLFRKECRFYFPTSEQETTNQRRSPESRSYFAGAVSGGGGNRAESSEQMGYHGNLTIPPSNSSPRLPIDLSAQPEKSNTPCSDSGHSSPDMAEDLRLAANNNPSSIPHYRRHNAPPMITLTSSNRSSPQRSYDKPQMRVLGGKNVHDNLGESAIDAASVPASPTKRFCPDYSQPQLQQHAGGSSGYQHASHIELRHRANTAERLSGEMHTHQGLHPITAARLLGRRRLSSDEGRSTASSAYSVDRHSTGALIGMGGAYHHGIAATIPVPCTVPSLAAGSAILSRLQHRRNSTGGAEAIRDSLKSSSPQHAASISSMPRRRSMDLDDVFLMEDESFETRKAAGGDCRLLWDFLVQLLKNKTYMPYIRWEDRRERVFRILDPVQIANLWGLQKNRTNMTYEKLSRALRYYYKMGILQKEQGQKLTYRFLQDPKDIANSQRFSKMARAKDAADHPEIARPSSSSQSSRLISSSSSTSPPIPSSSPSTAAASSLPSTPSMSMLSSAMAASGINQSRMYALSNAAADRLHPEDPFQRSPAGKRSSLHMTSGTTTPSPSPPTSADDPTALATHRSMEGVSMMALSSPWQGSHATGSNVTGQGLQVKEEPSSRPTSPVMER